MSSVYNKTSSCLAVPKIDRLVLNHYVICNTNKLCNANVCGINNLKCLILYKCYIIYWIYKIINCLLIKQRLCVKGFLDSILNIYYCSSNSVHAFEDSQCLPVFFTDMNITGQMAPTSKSRSNALLLNTLTT